MLCTAIYKVGTNNNLEVAAFSIFFISSSFSLSMVIPMQGYYCTWLYLLLCGKVLSQLLSTYF